MTKSELDERLDLAAELAIRIAAGDLDARATETERGDSIDAVITALNMLAEELQHERFGRQRAEELLQDEIDAYENAPALFCSLEAGTLVVEKCNKTLATALGRPKQAIIGASVLELLHPQYRGLARRNLSDLPLGTTSERGEAQLLRADGGHVVVSTAATRVIGSDGRERVRIVWRDITVERRLEAQLFQAQKLEAVGRLSGGVAHDFNNILSVISGSAEFIGEVLEARGVPCEDVSLIQQAVARGASLTSDLLAFAQNRPVEPVPTDVRTVIAEVERMVARLVGEHITVTTDTDDRMLSVLIDPSQLSQVLINLAINARDAMQRGGNLRISARRVELGAARAERLALASGGFVAITVADDGPGMTPEVLARAFDPFFTTKPVGSGSGLGLSTCYGIVQQARGRISIDSELGKGTTVHILLPESAASPRTRSSRPPANTPRGRETILVVEDDETVQTVIRRILERGGYHVITATDGQHALEQLAQFREDVDLVVTDINMPVMGGIELGAEVRRRRLPTRMLYLSGYTANMPVDEDNPERAAEFLAKPFTQSALLERVRRILDKG